MWFFAFWNWLAGDFRIVCSVEEKSETAEQNSVMSQVETRNSGAGDVDNIVRGASDGSKGCTRN